MMNVVEWFGVAMVCIVVGMIMRRRRGRAVQPRCDYEIWLLPTDYALRLGASIDGALVDRCVTYDEAFDRAYAARWKWDRALYRVEVRGPYQLRRVL